MKQWEKFSVIYTSKNHIPAEDNTVDLFLKNFLHNDSIETYLRHVITGSLFHDKGPRHGHVLIDLSP